jgi:class 3 adenylate cyclase
LLYESREGILVVKENIHRSSEDAATSSPDDGAAAGNVPYVERRLAAILSADVKDYSRLMGNDDVATVETLTAYREAMTRLISQHRGRVVDSPGD